MVSHSHTDFLETDRFKCPVCGNPVIEGEKGFGCSNWQNGYKFTIWKDDKYINNDNKNAENQNKYVIDPWALNAIQNKSNVSLEGMTTSEILYIADTVGIKLELDKDLGAYMLAFQIE